MSSNAIKDQLLLKVFASQEIAIRKARKSFWAYCQVMANDFYKKDRFYLRRVCSELQDFYYSDDEVLIITLPPRHGKSRTVGLFVEWILGKNNKLKVMTGSYNEILSQTFSKTVRNTIMEEKADATRLVYQDIFPETRISKRDRASNLWGLEGGHYNYLATSPSGTATGFGADILIVDDLIKNAEEAFNDRVLEKHWDWFTQTMLSRIQEGGKIIIVMTRWATKDLAGRAIEHFKEENKKVREIKMKAVQDDGSMLCEDVLSYASYKSKIRAMGTEVANANYQQEPIDIKGKLYSSFKTYTKAPKRFRRIINYVDTADQGDDNHVSIVAGEYDGELYVLDVIYTKDGMEKTEPMTAEQLHDYHVNESYIESNNGGRGFARNVERLLWEKYRTRRTYIKWFHQSENKMARILSNSTYVMNHIYFPENWKDRYPEFYKELSTFQKEGKNKHDDGVDGVTGLAELMADSGTTKISNINVW